MSEHSLTLIIPSAFRIIVLYYTKKSRIPLHDTLFFLESWEKVLIRDVINFRGTFKVLTQE
jgi:hypothetical protein